jgi:pimeloyl-ACP methyl ester carboxylesterase
MLNYRRAGKGPSLVLLHGFMGGSGYWQHQLDHWSNAFDVIAPDLPGFAGSATEPPCRSIQAMAQCVLDALDEIGVGDFLLLGHSMGGMVAQEIAAHAGSRTRKLVLYGTGSTGVLPGRFETIETSIARLHDEGVDATGKRIAATWFVAGEQAQAYSLCRQAGRGTTTQAAAAALTALQSWDGRRQLADLQMAVLVISGDGDRSCSPARAYELWSSIAQCSLCIIPRSGHATHLEAPEQFDLAVRGFLTSSSDL